MDMTEQQMIDYLRENGYEVYSKEEDEERENDFFHLSEDYKQNIIEKCKLRKELKEIKKKFESGQAVVLPCKVGDKVYCPVKSANRVAYGTLDWIDISTKNIVYTVVERSYEGIAHKRPIQYRVGYVFTTKEAAEAKLNELKGE